MRCRNSINALGILCFSALLLVASTAFAAEKVATMRIGTITTTSHPQTVTAVEFQKLADAQLKDQLKVQVFPTSQLGTIPQILQGLQNGSIQAAVMPNGMMSLLVPAVSIIDLPFFIPGHDWITKMINLGYDGPLQKEFEKKGAILLAAAATTDRMLFTSKPLTSVQDLEKMRIRTYTSPLNQQTIAAWGATPVNVDTAEITVAIQQGVADGIETDPTFWFAMKLFPARYLTTIHEGSICQMFVVSKKWFDSLPADVQAKTRVLAREAAAKAGTYLYNDMMPLILQAEKDNNAVVTTASPEMVAELKARSVKVVDSFLAANPDMQPLYDYYKDLIAKYPNGDAPKQ